MATQKRQMLTDEQIQNIQKLMEEAKQKPIEKRTYTKKETVLRLKKYIIEMQKKGYTLDEVRLFFEKNGLTISLSSLKSYMGGSTGTKKAKKSETSRTQNEPEKNIKKNTKQDIKQAEISITETGEHTKKKPLPTAVNDTKTMTMEQPKPDGSFKVTPDRPEY